MYVIMNIFVHSEATTEENHSLRCLWYRERSIIIVLYRGQIDWTSCLLKSEDIFYVYLDELYLVLICSLFCSSLKMLPS